MIRQQLIWVKRGNGALRTMWATVSEEESTDKREEIGYCTERVCSLLIRGFADIEPGDGVWLRLADGAPPWRVRSSKRHSLYTGAVLEAV